MSEPHSTTSDSEVSEMKLSAASYRDGSRNMGRKTAPGAGPLDPGRADDSCSRTPIAALSAGKVCKIVPVS